MATPKRKEILAKAKELWHEDRARRGDPAFDIEPEVEELRESGFISAAQSSLMRDKHRAEIESEFIDFPQKFQVDIQELFEANGLVLGSRHTGKSDIGMKISDKAVKENAVVVVFDPSLDWMKRSSISQYMKVETHTNLEVPSESIIYDISLLSPLQQQKIVESFSKRLFESQAENSERKQYLVIFEESHTYFYQGSMRAKNMQNMVRLLSVGRNVDVACLLVSQFAAMLDKFAVKHALSQSWFGFTKEPNDISYLRQILGEDVEQLKKLEDGEFVYLNRSGKQKIQIQPYQSDIRKTQVKPSAPQHLEPKTEPKKSYDSSGLLKLLMLVVWLFILAVAVKPV